MDGGMMEPMDAKLTAGSKKTERQRLVIAVLDHRRVGDHADRSGRRGAGTGDGREVGAGEDRADGKASGQMAHPGVHDVEQVVADVSVEQELAHDDEDGDRQRVEALQRSPHRRADQTDRQVEHVDEDQRRAAQAEGNGHAHGEDKQQNSDNEKEISHL